MRIFACEICGRKIGQINRTLTTEFPMIYSGDITICGDLCAPCKEELQTEFDRAVKILRREKTA